MRFVVFLSALLASSSAEAGWRYASWGMTPEALLAASGGQAVATRDGNVRATSLNVEEDGRRFTVHFLFEGDRLDTVDFSGLWGNACYRLRNDLANRYGPDQVIQAGGGSQVRRWEDTASGNIVLLLVPSPGLDPDLPCLLQYRNLARQAG